MRPLVHLKIEKAAITDLPFLGTFGITQTTHIL